MIGPRASAAHAIAGYESAMESPLAELDAWWSVADDEGGGSTDLGSLVATADGCRIEFETVDDADARALWRLDVQDAVEIVWRGGSNDPRWFEDHVLLWPFLDPPSGISTAKPLKDPLRAYGGIARVHDRTFGRWFPLARFLTGSPDVAFGQLALGPERAMALYGEALLALGEDIHVAPYNRASLREETPVRPSVLTWGESSFVARSFRLARID